MGEGFGKGKPSVTYKAYTKQFDQVVSAKDLDRVLGHLSYDNKMALDEAWLVVQAGLLPWRSHLLLSASDAEARIKSILDKPALQATAITLLIDLSGSMRGQRMLYTAATLDVLYEFLIHLGVQFEVLGFTTTQWRGGRSRARWNWRLRPANPGRLNDLLHLILTSADDRHAPTGSYVYRVLLRHDLPKENIDGEAIEWAANRLLAQSVSRRLLLVVSDGAPVDDSTLLANGLSYLTEHLGHVLAKLKSQGQIEIGALGIGHDVDRYYDTTRQVELASDIGPAVLTLVEHMLGHSVKLQRKA